MSGKQTMTWNGDANTKLLVAILKVCDVKLDYEALAKQFTTDEITCTPRAVQEQLKKLRKLVPVEDTPGAPSKSATTTPSKASRKATAAATGVKKSGKPATGTKGKKGKATVNADDAEDVHIEKKIVRGDDDHTPAPKKRKYNDAVDGSSDVGEESRDDESAA